MKNPAQYSKRASPHATIICFSLLIRCRHSLISGGLDTIYGIEINCTSPNIYLNFNMKDSASFAKESFNLRDSSCVPYVMTPTKVLVKTRLDTCGTTSTHANDTVTYHNSLLVKVNGIRETERIEFPFSCTFGKQSEIGTPSFQTRQRLMLYRGMYWAKADPSSGPASFWGGAYMVRKWTRNLRTKIRKCVPTKRNGETNDAFQKHFTTGFSEINIVRKWCALSFHNTGVPSVVVHVMC